MQQERKTERLCPEVTDEGPEAQKETASQRTTCCLTDRSIRDRDRANGWHDMMDATKKSGKMAGHMAQHIEYPTQKHITEHPRT